MFPLLPAWTNRKCSLVLVVLLVIHLLIAILIYNSFTDAPPELISDILPLSKPVSEKFRYNMNLNILFYQQKQSVHSGMKGLVADKVNNEVVLEDEINVRKVIHQQFIAPDSRTERTVLNPLDFEPICTVKSMEAISAINRATTQKCKEDLMNISCLMQSNKLYPKKLPRLCHLRGMFFSLLKF